MGYTLNFAVVWRNFDLLLGGLGLSLGLAFVSIVIGIAIGLFTAFLLNAKRSIAHGAAVVYVAAIRNTPILILILFTYFALPQMGVRLDKLQSFIFTMAIYAGAYLAEVFRGALLGVPKGLREAGLAIGLTELQIKKSITIPIMVRNALPALSSTFISLFKDTSLAATIAVPELTFYARKINNESFRVIETWSVTCLIYVATCVVLAALLRLLERRMAIPR
ncbi:MAG TPA: amino acid ABC transporter permease [Devosiaceae bacterium]|jgi:polar amino acid transport system permease protein|nr:amino acid ABC transporter permease [Devosiaceae bacterium]